MKSRSPLSFEPLAFGLVPIGLTLLGIPWAFRVAFFVVPLVDHAPNPSMLRITIGAFVASLPAFFAILLALGVHRSAHQHGKLAITALIGLAMAVVELLLFAAIAIALARD
jgi:hypothetical protein